MSLISWIHHSSPLSKGALMGFACLTLAACANQGQLGGDGTGAISSAPVSGDFVLSSSSAGPITQGTAFSQEEIKRLYPGKRLQTTRIANDQGTFHALSVYSEGLQTVAIQPSSDNRKIAAVHGVGPDVAGPNGERIGMTFAEVGQNASRCQVGRKLWLGMPICRANGTQNVLLVFDPGQDVSGNSNQMPPRAALQKARLQRIVWQPAG